MIISDIYDLTIYARLAVCSFLILTTPPQSYYPQLTCSGTEILRGWCNSLKIFQKAPTKTGKRIPRGLLHLKPMFGMRLLYCPSREPEDCVFSTGDRNRGTGGVAQLTECCLARSTGFGLRHCVIWIRWYISVTLAGGKWRKKDQKFKVRLG